MAIPVPVQVWTWVNGPKYVTLSPVPWCSQIVRISDNWSTSSILIFQICDASLSAIWWPHFALCCSISIIDGFLTTPKENFWKNQIPIPFLIRSWSFVDLENTFAKLVRGPGMLGVGDIHWLNMPVISIKDGRASNECDVLRKYSDEKEGTYLVCVWIKYNWMV